MFNVMNLHQHTAMYWVCKMMIQKQFFFFGLSRQAMRIYSKEHYYKAPFQQEKIYYCAMGNWIRIRVNPMVVSSTCTNKGEFLGI